MIVRLHEAIDQANYGGKAARLAQAIRTNLPVPPGIVLPVAVVDAIAAGDGCYLDPLDRELVVHGALAVRSSAVGEDSARASFAGQLMTRLNVKSMEAVLEAVRAIWHSARGPSVHAYRLRFGLPLEPRVAVVVQKFVAADVAGVLFTRNPVSATDERLIEANWGLGESVVAGLVTPDRYRVSRAGEVLESVPGIKRVIVRPGGSGGTVREPVADDRVNRLCLSSEQLLRLHELACRCEEVFEGGQDLEWAFQGTSLHLLQCRPVTYRTDKAS